MHMNDSLPIVWMTGVTADHTVDVNVETRDRILRALIQYDLPGLGRAIEAPSRDYELRCDDPELFERVRATANTFLNDHTRRSDVGGSPAVSALAGIALGGNVHYGGNVGEAAEEVLRSRYNGQSGRFIDGNPQTADRSETIGLELMGGAGKVMISHSEGRALVDLDEDALVQKIRDLYDTSGNMMLAFAGLNKGQPSAYQDLVTKLRDGRPNTKLFVGTNSFGANGKAVERAGQYWGEIIGAGDIISMNELEASAVYRTLGGPEAKPTVVDMVQYIDARTEGMVVVHTSAGAVASTNGFDHDAVRYALEMAVAGATFRYQEGKFGTEKEVADFAGQNGWAYDGFTQKVGVPHSDVPGDLVYAIAHDLKGQDTKGNLTGAGATFDGTLLVNLTPLYKD